MASIFTKILNKEIPGKVIYEDDDFFAILDIHPKQKGHTLLIPKKEFENIFEFPGDLSPKLVPVIQKVANLLKDKLNADGVKIVQNNGKATGQEVFHFHIHLIPYYLDEENAANKGDLESVHALLT